MIKLIFTYKKLLFILFCVVLCFFIKFQQFVYKEVPIEMLINNEALKKYEYDEIKLKSVVDATNYLPAGYKENAELDYTENIQKAIDENKIIKLPNFPLLINENGLSLNDNSTVIFQKKSKLILKENNLKFYQILRIHSVKNVNIYSPNIEGDRYKHLGDNGGEWGFGISIKGSKNINVFNSKVTNCWGDGIYIGGLNNISSSKINIFNSCIDNNRRNGISITSAKDVKIDNAIISNTNGTNPKSGIDVEANTNNDIIDNICLKNVKTFNNNGNGIIISLSRLTGKLKKNVNIEIKNHYDNNSNIGLAISLSKLKYDKEVLPLTGTLKVLDSKWKSNKKKDFKFYDSPYNRMDLFYEGKKITSSINSYKIVDESEIKKITQKND